MANLVAKKCTIITPPPLQDLIDQLLQNLARMADNKKPRQRLQNWRGHFSDDEKLATGIKEE